METFDIISFTSNNSSATNSSLGKMSEVSDREMQSLSLLYSQSEKPTDGNYVQMTQEYFSAQQCRHIPEDPFHIQTNYSLTQTYMKPRILSL